MAETNDYNKKKCSLNKIKSNFIFKRIFDNLKEVKKLDIIRYNKSFQNKLNKDIDDYFNEYSKIEIDLIPFDNKCGKFINITKNNIPHYHIYFNDNKEEEKRKYFFLSDKVKKIKIIIDYSIKSISGLFSNIKCIKKINFVQFHRRNIEDMSCLFRKCSYLEELNISNLKADNVFMMNDIFYECSSLKEINLSKFITNNVIDMSCMFYGCQSLKKLNLSNFNTNNVINMSYLFCGCLSLKKIKISNF